MLSLSRTEILSIIPRLDREPVAVPEWGGAVNVRMMTAAERDRFEVLLAEGKRTNFRALLAAFTACDDAGARLFTEADVPALAAQPASALERIAVVALRLCRFTADDVEDIRKNSESGPSDASS